MDKLRVKLEKETDLSNIIPMKQALVGIDGGLIPPGSDWLSPLPEGTEFFCKMVLQNAPPTSLGGQGQAQPPRFVLHLGMVRKCIGKARIVSLSANGQSQDFPVDPKEFCKAFEKFEIINDDDSDKLPTNDSNWTNKPA